MEDIDDFHRLDRDEDEDEDEGYMEDAKGKEKDESRRFWCCYLLTSANPKFKDHTYIGFTIDPMRRFDGYIIILNGILDF